MMTTVKVEELLSPVLYDAFFMQHLEVFVHILTDFKVRAFGMKGKSKEGPHL